MNSSARVSRPSLIVGVVSAVLATALLGVFASPAQAAGIGSGRAVVHVDAPKATATRQADGSYLLSLPTGTTGQWMGERTNAAGKKKVRVGSLTAEQLTSSWSDLKYRSAGATGTLVWNMKASVPSTAVVHVSSPKTTSSGVTFVLKSATDLPQDLTQMSLNLDRAPGKSMRASTSPYSQSAVIADALTISLVANTVTSATPRIYNSGNSNTCWQSTLSANASRVGVKSNTCDNIAYDNANGLGGSAPYGVIAEFSSKNCSATFSLQITPPDQAMYTYAHTFSWTVSN